MGILRGSNPLADIEPSVEIDREKAHFLCMKHLTLVVLLFLLLSACESGFDRCMRTELPRAAKDLGLDEAREALSQLEEASSRAEFIVFAQDENRDWETNNPMPSEPKRPEIRDFKTFDDWDEANDEWYSIPAIKDWHAKRNEAYFSSLREAGGDIGTTEEYERWYDEFESLLMPRAMRNDCWGVDECEFPLSHEHAYIEDQKNTVLEYDAYSGKMYVAAMSDAIAWQTSHLQEIENSVFDTATRACNANGFYE